MDARERFVRTLTGREVDRVPFMPIFGVFSQTRAKWHAEQPERMAEVQAIPFEGKGRGWAPVDVNVGPSRTLPRETIEDTPDHELYRDGDGTVRMREKASAFTYHIVDYPVKSADDWHRYKARFLDPDDPARFPANWKALCAQYARRDYPLMLKHHGVYGYARNVMGDEALMYAFYDDPGLVHDIMTTVTDLALSIWKRVLPDVRPDLVECWEDMASKNGSLISRAMFEEFMAPQYRRITDFAAENGIEIVLVDSDGLVDELADWFAEVGVNALYPFEVRAGSDPAATRRRLPGLGMLGGLEKDVLAAGREAIDAEVEKAEALIKLGRFIPGVDHSPLPNAILDNYVYFYGQLRRVVMSTRPGQGGSTFP